jgi:hypothetical protein
VGSVSFGPENNGNLEQTAGEVWFDDIIIDDKPIGCAK